MLGCESLLHTSAAPLGVGFCAIDERTRQEAD